MPKHCVMLALIAILLFGGGAFAMSSFNYRLDWYTLPLAAGGGPSASPHYRANFTIGQPTVISMSSTNYRLGLGYWNGLPLFGVHLPVILRNQ